MTHLLRKEHLMSLGNAPDTLEASKGWQPGTLSCTLEQIGAASHAEADAAKEWEKNDIILGLYEVLGVVGEGAYGKVYKVAHLGWNVELAVKTMKAELSLNERHKLAFVKECEGWVKLGLHPNIVSCYYVRELGGALRIFSEYMAGGSLDKWIARRDIHDIPEIIRLGIQCLNGLSFSHHKGLIHRDIKPLNCLLTSNGNLKITDFGIASGLAGMDVEALQPGSAAPAEHTAVIREGAVGTPAYMPPEQWSKQYGAIGPWSDIYSLGVMLFEMCCGERPFDEGSESPKIVEARHINSMPPDPGEIRKDVPEEFARFILRCLEKRPEKRFTCCDDAKKELQEIYGEITGASYREERSEPAGLESDSLNNRAASLIDIGRIEDAECIWKEAISIDTLHLQALYNIEKLKWSAGRIDDLKILEFMISLKQSHQEKWESDYLIGLAHTDRDDCKTAIEFFQKALSRSGDNPEVKRSIQLAGSRLQGSTGFLKELQSSGKPVKSVFLSSDCRLSLSGSYDKKLILWDNETGEIIRRLEGHKGAVNSAAFSPLNNFALSGSEDGTIKIWEIASGECINTLTGHEAAVRAIFAAPRSGRLLSGGADKSLVLWDTETGESTIISKKLNYEVTAVRTNSDASIGFSAGGQIIDVWDLLSGAHMRTLAGHEGPVKAIFLDSEGRFLLSGGGDKKLKIWSAATGECVKSIDSHLQDILSVQLSADGKWALAGGKGGIKVYNLLSGKCVRTFEGHGLEVSSLSMNDGKGLLLSGSWDGSIRLWHIKTENLAKASGFVLSRIRTVEEIDESRERFYSLLDSAAKSLEKRDWNLALQELSNARRLTGYEHSPEAIIIWNRLASRMRKKSVAAILNPVILKGHKKKVNAICMNREGTLVLSGSDDSALKLFDVEKEECVRTFTEHRSPVKSAYLSPGFALSGSGTSLGEDCSLRLWDITKGECLKTFEGHKGPVNDLILSPDCKWALSGSSDGTLRLWSVTSGTCARTLEGHKGPVNTVCMSPDTRWAISGSEDGTLRLWNLITGRCERVFEGHEAPVHAADIDFKTSLLISGSGSVYREHTIVKLWDIFTGENLRSFEGHEDRVTSVSLSADGKWALSGSEDGTIRIWDISKGECARIIKMESKICAACFSPDGCSILCACEDRSIKIFPLDWELEPIPDNFQGDEIKPYLVKFLASRTPCGGILPENRMAKEREARMSLARRGVPVWSETDLEDFMRTLGFAGLGWLNPSDVKKKLEELKPEWERIAAADYELADMRCPLCDGETEIEGDICQKCRADTDFLCPYCGKTHQDGTTNCPNTKRDIREYWIFEAFENGDLERVRNLIREGVNVNAKGSHGRTCMHLAAMKGEKEIVSLLIKKGAELDIKDNHGVTPLRYAASGGHSDVVYLISSSGKELQTFYNLVLPYQNLTKAVKLIPALIVVITIILLYTCNEMMVNEKNGQHKIFTAAANGEALRLRMMLLLDPDLAHSQACGGHMDGSDVSWSPIHLAAKNGRTEAVRILISYKADVNGHGRKGVTPLHLAAKEGHKDIVEILLQQGAGVNEKDAFGRTPLDNAKERGFKDVETLLISNGAKRGSDVP